MSGAYWKQVLEDGLEVPTDRPLDELTAELTRMLGSTDPGPPRRHGLPRARHLDRPWRVRRAPHRAGRRHGRRAGRGARRERHRHRLPADVQRAGPGHRGRARHLRSTWCRPRRCCGGATRSCRGTCGSATSAASSPARAGRTRWPTAPTRSASLAGSRHFGLHELTVLLDVLADRLLSDRRPAAVRRAGPDGRRGDGDPAPQPGADAASSSRGSPGSRPTPTRSADRAGRRPLRADQQRPAAAALALPPAGDRAAAAGRPGRPGAGARSTRCAPPTRSRSPADASVPRSPTVE